LLSGNTGILISALSAKSHNMLTSSLTF